MEKFKNIFKNKKVENLVAFLIILVITLIIINNIIKEDDNNEKQPNYSGAELASSNNVEVTSDDFEKRLENILSKIDGVGEVSVLITYSESSQIVPLYNENISKSVTEENDTSRAEQEQ